MPESTTSITLGEISRNIDGARKDLAKLQTAVESRPDWEDVKRVERGLELQIKAAETAANTKDALQDMAIAKLEGWGNWATKAAGGVIIAALLVRSGLG